MTEQNTDRSLHIPQWGLTAIISIAIAAGSWFVTTLNNVENEMGILREKVDTLEEQVIRADQRFVSKEAVQQKYTAIERQIDGLEDNIRYLFLSRQELLNRMFVPQKIEQQPPKN